jgi:hypothetical protein
VKRLLLISVFVAAIAACGSFAGNLAAGVAQTPNTVIEARLGDRISVVDAPIGCRVARLSQLGGRVAVDCRRAGPLRGTYGTLFTAREAALVQFESRRKAKRIAVATHEGEIRRCK